MLPPSSLLYFVEPAMHVSTLFSLLVMLTAPWHPTQILGSTADVQHFTPSLLCSAADDLLRILRDLQHQSRASAFCTNFLQRVATLPASTPAMTTPTQPSIADTNISTTLFTSILGDMTSLPTLTVTRLATPFSTPAKCDHVAPYPAWLSTTYDSTRLSSACSCLV